jgi:hypothetical protein
MLSDNDEIEDKNDDVQAESVSEQTNNKLVDEEIITVILPTINGTD